MTQNMKIITPIRPQNVDELKSWLENLDSRVDMIELWPENFIDDMIKNPGLFDEILAIIRAAKSKHNLELLGVCKTPAEKGTFTGSNAQRVQILQQFLRFGGDLVDLDVSQNPADLIIKLPASKLCLSFHDFNNADLDIIKAQYTTMQVFGPKLYKFSVTPQNQKQLKDFTTWAKNLKDPAIFTTMGEFGLEGREQLKPVTWGAFYALNKDCCTASGQPTLADL